MKNAACVCACLLILPFSPSSLHAQPADSPWPMYRHDARHTGQSPYNLPQYAILKWSYVISTPGIFGTTSNYASPVIGLDGSLFMGSISSQFYCFRSTGVLGWSYDTSPKLIIDPECPTAAVGAQGQIYVGGNNQIFYCMQSNGSVYWTYWDWNDGGVGDPPAIGTDGSVYVRSRYCCPDIIKFSPDGSILWTFTTGHIVRTSPAVDLSNNVYIGSYDNLIYSIASDGTMRWSYETGEEPYYTSYYPSPSIGMDGTLYQATYDNRLYSIDTTGSLRWSYDTGSPSATAAAIGESGNIYLGDELLLGMDSGGSLRWSYSVGSMSSSPILDSSENICFGGETGLWCFDSSGFPLWNYMASGSVNSPPSVGSDGTIQFNCSNGRLFAIYAPTPTLTIDPGQLHAGQGAFFTIRLTQDIADEFDYYVVADTPVGAYSLHILNRKVEKGIHALYRKVRGYKAPFEILVVPDVIIPQSMIGSHISFYTAAVKAGKAPPVPSLFDLKPDTPYVIKMDKKVMTVQP